MGYGAGLRGSTRAQWPLLAHPVAILLRGISYPNEPLRVGRILLSFGPTKYRGFGQVATAGLPRLWQLG